MSKRCQCPNSLEGIQRQEIKGVNEIMDDDIKTLEEATQDIVTFYNALRDFLLDLRALNNPKINQLFEKYKVKVI